MCVNRRTVFYFGLPWGGVQVGCLAPGLENFQFWRPAQTITFSYMLSIQCGHISAPAAMGTLWEGLAAPLVELGAGPGPGLRWVCAARVRTLQITFGRAGGWGMAAGVGGLQVLICFHALYFGGDGGVLGVPVSRVFVLVLLLGGRACAACYTPSWVMNLFSCSRLAIAYTQCCFRA